MNQLIKVSQFLYFFLFMILLAFVCIHRFTGETTIHTNLILLFSVILLPLFDGAYDALLGEENKELGFKKINYIIGVGLGLIIGGGLFMGGYLSFGSILMCAALLAVYMGLNAKIFCVAGLILFCYIGFFLVLGQNAQAESLSIYAYYLLFAAVFVQIGQSFLSPKNTIQY